MGKGPSVSDEERDSVFASFRQLVKPIAKAFYRKYGKVPLDLDDFEQDGNLGLLAAAALKGKMLTREYANVSIRNAINKSRKELWPEDTERIEIDVPDPASEREKDIDLEKARESLEPLENEVIHFTIDCGMTDRGAAEVLGKSKSTISRINRAALEKLRNSLGRGTKTP